MSRAVLAQEHNGHDVICERCGLVAIEFIDYNKAIREGRIELYNRNKCNCTLPTEFYCNDCKERLSVA